MTAQPMRLPDGGLIDRSRPLTFRFDGEAFTGFAGDTLASALLANGVRLAGRSFKLHRPRGIVGIGTEEPNALVRLRDGARAEPNTRATVAELYDGLIAESQNRWPSRHLDLMALTGLLSPLLPAGFYYKTFLGTAKLWTKLFEPPIRRAAGMGEAPDRPDPDAYERRHAAVDVLVVGAGAAGLAAALAAGRAGARVLLVDEAARPGGWLLRERVGIGGLPGAAWADGALAELAGLPNVTVLPRTTAFGLYDHNQTALVERVADHLAVPPSGGVRQRLWSVAAKRIVLATGAIERPVLFSNNDRPGIMLAGAARGYVNQYAVRPGSAAVVFAGAEDGYRSALDLHAAGVRVAAVADPRPAADGPLVQAVRRVGIEVLAGHAVVGATGRSEVTGAMVVQLDGERAAGAPRPIACDLLAASAGWMPNLLLHAQTGAKPRYDAALGVFVPGAEREGLSLAGAARGRSALADALADGFAAGAEAAQAAGHGSGTAPDLPDCDELPAADGPALWAAPRVDGVRGKRFVDLQHDVTDDDVALAHREGYRSVEHLKRYTTLGMGTDQGRTANLNAITLMAALRGEAPDAVGTWAARAPVSPVALGALAGRSAGEFYLPRRLTPFDGWHRAAGAIMLESGAWMRPRCYPRRGETPEAAVAREALAVRTAAGVVDVSTLGKVDVQGRDAAVFLDRVYANAVGSLAIGKARYAVMLREDGILLDDGTVQRLGEERFLLSTTTAHAAKILAHLEFLAQVVWPELDVAITDVTEQWAVLALAGPNSRAVLAAATETDVCDAALPHMALAEARIAGAPVRLARLSYSGERAYEIYIPAGRAVPVLKRLMQAGAPHGLIPYGLEAMGILRIEKGHVAGPEIDGRTTAADLGLGKLPSRKKDYIGRAGLSRPVLNDPDRLQLVGLVPVEGGPLRAGAQLVADPDQPPPMDTLGHVTSAAQSPTLGHTVALALLRGGTAREGALLHALDPVRGVRGTVRVVAPVFVDPEGERLRG